MRRTALASPTPPGFPSPADLAHAEGTLHTHRPRQVVRVECGCGQPWPCADVRFARLVRAAA